MSWLASPVSDQQVLRKYFAALGARQVERYELSELRNVSDERDKQIAERDKQIAERDKQIAERDKQISEMLNSRSWQLTKPLRSVVQQVRGVKSKIRLQGGLKPAMKKVRLIIRDEGGLGLVERLKGRSAQLGVSSTDYRQWIKKFDAVSDELKVLQNQELELENKPTISIIMPVYSPPLNLLDQAIKSVRNQRYPYWELCIADDKSPNEEIRNLLNKHQQEDERIKVVFREENGHISEASNSALALASGEYIALLDHDDLLPRHALLYIAESINNFPDADLFYSDEDKIDIDGNRLLPSFKPDWSPHLAISQAYLGHFVCLRTSLVRELGGWCKKYDGAQDFDLWLRVSLQARRIVHIPKILYHWRLHANSTALDHDSKPYAHEAGRLAVQSYLENRYPGIGIEVCDGNDRLTLSALFNLSQNLKVSIIIPTRDRVDLLQPCVESILELTTWDNFEIIILDNGSTDTDTLDYLNGLHELDTRINVFSADMPFNWSRLNNFGSKCANGDVLVFLNNDTKVITEDWLQSLAGYSCLPDVGTVGALLLFEDGTIQHSGVVVGMGGWADHVFSTEPPVHSGAGPFVSPVLTRNVLAVTGACMAIERKKFDQLGGFDEDFVICGSDVELCLRVHRNGLYNVMCADVRLTHFESKTRSSHVPEEDFIQSNLKYAPYREEQMDPFYNPNLCRKHTRPNVFKD